MLSFGSTIHEDSGEGMKSELDLFSVPFTVQQGEAGSYIYIQPIAPVQMADTIDFVVPGSGDQYIDLSKTVLEIGGRFINRDAPTVKLTGAVKVLPVNKFMHSLF